MTEREVLLLAQRMCREALPKFNWGSSSLDANAIDLLNRAPLAIDAALASPDMEQRAGFVMVPVEPTEQMLTAASVTRARRDEANLCRHEVAAIYGAMLAAAPPIEALEGGKTDLGASGPVHQDTSSTPASALDRHQFDYGPYGYQCKRCGAIWSEFNGMNTNGPCRRS